MKSRLYLALSALVILAFIVSACNLSYGALQESASASETSGTPTLTPSAPTEPESEPTEDMTDTDGAIEQMTVTPEATSTEITHEITPGEPGFISRWFNDTDSSRSASTGNVTGGDDYVANLYERPFTREDMAYRPDVDIRRAEITSDETFYYVNILVKNEHPDGGLPGMYGVEIDWDRDGRGDLLVMAESPAPDEWSIEGVKVVLDSNNDVGGARVLRPDAGYSGDSYDEVQLSEEILGDPDLAWSRWTTDGSPTITLAFKKSLVERKTFVWNVWAAESLLSPDNFDLHDHFSQAEAGSPYSSHSNYPLAEINLVDNTCRETFGFEATAPIPGLCYVPEPTPTPTPTLTPNPTATPTDQLPLGSIGGIAFDDTNNNGIRDAGEPLTTYSITINLRSGSCSGAILSYQSSKSFRFSGLVAGDYCVEMAEGGPMTTPSEYLISLPAGGSEDVWFGFQSPN